jgi:predicted short-subunit dehydrogenase-like oxidoreductase (DUF2520 family)
VSELRGTRVAVVGPGRVGATLAAGCVRAGLRLVAVAGGSGGAAGAVAARHAGARVHEHAAGAVADADLVLLCTPDDALAAVVTEVAVADGWREHHRVVHVSGASGLAPLRRAGLAGARVAACHPAQTFPAVPPGGAPDPDRLLGVRWAVTCAPADVGWAHEFVTLLGGDATDLPDAARVLYHAGLTVGANAVGAAVAVARQLLLAALVDDPAGFLGPLVEASVANVLRDGASALTGPVVRGDSGTVAAHLDALDADVPVLADAYRHLAAVVLGQVRAALPAGDAAALDALLTAPGTTAPQEP